MKFISFVKATLLLGIFAAVPTAQAQVTLGTFTAGTAPGAVSTPFTGTINSPTSAITVHLNFTTDASAPNGPVTFSLTGTGGSPGATTFAHGTLSATANTTYDISFSDAAATVWPSSSDSLGTSGTFKSDASLAGFIAIPTGTWTLTIGNGSGAGINVFLNSASISAVPEPGTYLVVFGFMAMGMGVYRRTKTLGLLLPLLFR